MHEQERPAGDHPGFPRRTAPGALESAARFLGVFAEATSEASTRSRSFRQGREERDLEAWARESGCWLANPREALRLLDKGGEEHRVFAGGDFYLKATYPGRFGFTVVAGPVYPWLAPAFPSEYLRRLLLSNDHFGDSIQLEGITREAGQLVILTSQPTVVGEAATADDIVAFMRRRRLELLDGLEIGHAGALCFHRDLDQLAVFDAHPANVLKDGRGVVLPIDLVMVAADDALARQLAKTSR